MVKVAVSTPTHRTCQQCGNDNNNNCSTAGWTREHNLLSYFRTRLKGLRDTHIHTDAQTDQTRLNNDGLIQHIWLVERWATFSGTSPFNKYIYLSLGQVKIQVIRFSFITAVVYRYMWYMALEITTAMYKSHMSEHFYIHLWIILAELMHNRWDFFIHFY